MFLGAWTTISAGILLFDYPTIQLNNKYETKGNFYKSQTICKSLNVYTSEYNNFGTF